MVRECSLSYITRAGVEVGVASTNAFTQLAALFLLTLTLAQVNGRLSDEQEAEHLKQMRHIPVALSSVLALEPQIIAWAEHGDGRCHVDRAEATQRWWGEVHLDSFIRLLCTLATRACAKRIPERIAGVIHGVMPALGAPVRYRRMACGMESDSPSNGWDGQRQHIKQAGHMPQACSLATKPKQVTNLRALPHRSFLA